VIAVCLMHIINEAREERATRNAELSHLRTEIERQLRKPPEDSQKTIGEMEGFKRRVKSVRGSPQQILEALAARRELGAFGYTGTRTNQFRSSYKPRVSPKEWRQ
jgi:hypothetical protein